MKEKDVVQGIIVRAQKWGQQNMKQWIVKDKDEFREIR